MGRYWRVIGHYTGEAQTYEALAGGFQSSPYTPDEDARLINVRTIVNAEAATSLVEGGMIRISSTTFKPNAFHVVFSGNGLQTVPATPQGYLDHPVDQPVKSGVPITLEGRHVPATAVTANVLVLGLFQS